MNCSHFPACGGCKTQDIPYHLQLEEKQRLLQSLFPEQKLEPIIGCKNPWQYRNKMEFSFSQNKAGEKFLGLILKKSRGKVFNLYDCAIAPKNMAEVLSRVRAWWEKTTLPAFHFHSGTGALRTLTLRRSFYTGQKMAILTVSGNPQFALTKKEIAQFIEAIDDPDMSLFLQIHQAIKGKPTQFFEMHLAGPTHIVEKIHLRSREFQFHISPTSFFQPNTEQAEVLYEKALSLANLTPEIIAYDLYCGTGTLGILCAPHVQEVIGIELNPHAVFDGQMNARANGISNISFLAGDVAQILSQKGLPKPDLVIVDPPRVGLGPQALEILDLLGASEILYISCNPVSQANDIRELKKYEVVHLQSVDQFPHTPHLEVICLLKHKLT